MKPHTSDTMIDTFDCGYDETYATYTGEIIECTSKRIGSGYKYTVTNLIVYTISGYKMLSVSLPAGELLYKYMHSENRRQRMNKIRFEFTVHKERQRVKAYKAFDPEGWIGDALQMEKVCSHHV